MSLSSAINTAQQSLSNTSLQTSVISRNISNASNPDYNRRSAILATTMFGASVVTTQRSQNEMLLREGLRGTAGAAGQNTLLTGLERLQSIYGGNDYESSPAALLTIFRDTLSTLAVKPSESTLAETVIADAVQLAAGLRNASQQVQETRLAADRAIAQGVETLNNLLADFKKVNDAVIRGTNSGADINAELDQREKLLKQIAEIVPVSTVTRSGNDLSIYTADGLTLFERVPRPVTFEPSNGFSAMLEGNAIYVDGAELSAGQGAVTTGGGSLQAHLQIRDDYAPKMQSQLDEIARGLVTIFAEGGAPGLFTWTDNGAPGGVPAAGTLAPGIAASIEVSAAVQTSLGGDPNRLRDGSINGGTANPDGNASFSDLLDSYVQLIDEPMAVDPQAGLGPSTSLSGFAADSIGWLEQNRSDAATAAETKDAYLFRTMEAYSNSTGVSLDEELAMLLELEQSYKASARLIAAVDEMLQALMAAA